jgi:hypothetical protein
MIPSTLATPDLLRRYNGSLEHYSDHEYPYTTLGPLQSHVHPHLALINTAVKLRENWKNFFPHLSAVFQHHNPDSDAYGLIARINDIYGKWMPAREDGDRSKSRAKSSRERGASGFGGSRSQRSDGKKTGRGNSLPSIGELYPLRSAQGGGGGNVDDELGNPGMIANTSGDSLQDKSSSSSYYYDDEYEGMTEEKVAEVAERIDKWRINVADVAEVGRDQCRVGHF